MNKSDIILALENKKIRKSKVKHYSVFIPIIEINGEMHILYEIRSKALRSQPNEICFPGGKIEDSENPRECAVRETMEELNIDEKSIEIITPLSTVAMPYNIIIHPFAGFLYKSIKEIDYSSSEVENIFSVPLDFLLKSTPEKYEVSSVLSIPDYFPFEKIQDGKNYKWRKSKYNIYFYEYMDKIIWGLTARITHEFIEILNTHNGKI